MPRTPSARRKSCNDLVALYLDENVKARQQSVAQTTAFLTEEAERLAKQIQEIESNLATFKRRYAGRLPDSAAVNMQLADRMQSELLRVEREISMLQDRKLYLEAQLPLVKPNAPPPDEHRPEERRPHGRGAAARAAGAVHEQCCKIRRRPPRYPTPATRDRRAQGRGRSVGQ